MYQLYSKRKKKEEYIIKIKIFTSHSNNDKGKNDLKPRSFINISRLYLIRRVFIEKGKYFIFSSLGVLFCASLYTIVFKYEVDLSVYYFTWLIIPILMYGLFNA